MTSDLLRDELLGLPGVESAVIEGDALTPEGVRVRLAAGVDATTVGDEIQRVLAAHGLRSEMAPPADAVIVESPLRRPDLPSATARPETLAKIAIVEGRDGVTVRAETNSGRTADRSAWASGERLDAAVIEAVSELAGVSPAPIVLSIEERDVEGSIVVTIVMEHGKDRAAGSSVIDGGRPFALGQATWMALER